MKKVEIQRSSLPVSTISFVMGGKHNRETGILVLLTLRATTRELGDVSRVINRIEDIHIDTSHLINPDTHDLKNTVNFNIKALATYISNLTALECVKKEKNIIHQAAYTLCQNTINQMPFMHVEMGKIGYDIYEKQGHVINQLIEIMSRAFIKAGIIETDFIYQDPQKHAHDSTHKKVKAKNLLPIGLSNFVLSIDDDDASREAWGTHLQTYDSDVLSGYFSEIKDELLKLSAKPQHVERIIKKLSTFASSLQESYPLLTAVEMMFLLANQGDNSPERQMRHKRESRAPLRELTVQIDDLFIPSRTFNDDFATFRNDLSRVLERSETNTEEILLALQRHLRYKHTPTENTKTLKKYIDRCVVRLEYPIPVGLLSDREVLRSSYDGTAPHTRPNNKLIFLEQWIGNISSYPTKTYAECFRLTQNTIQANICALSSEWGGCSLFAQHRFKNFISALKHAEPDYDKTHPQSLSQSALVLS